MGTANPDFNLAHPIRRSSQWIGMAILMIRADREWLRWLSFAVRQFKDGASWPRRPDYQEVVLSRKWVVLSTCMMGWRCAVHVFSVWSQIGKSISTKLVIMFQN